MAEAFCAYLAGNPIGWRHAFEFERVEVRTPAYRAGYRLGRAAGLARRYRWPIVAALLLALLLISLGCAPPAG